MSMREFKNIISFYKGIQLNRDVLSLIDRLVHKKRLQKVHNELCSVISLSDVMGDSPYEQILIQKWSRKSLYAVACKPNFVMLDYIFTYEFGNIYYYVWKNNNTLLRKIYDMVGNGINVDTKRAQYEMIYHALRKRKYNCNREFIYGIDIGFSNIRGIGENLGGQW